MLLKILYEYNFIPDIYILTRICIFCKGHILIHKGHKRSHFEICTRYDLVFFMNRAYAVSMKSKTGVSVIIPTFNRAEFLYTTLLCLCSQKAECEYEIIIIDSGNDKTESLVKMFQNRMQKNIVYKKIKRCRNRSLFGNIEKVHNE